MALQLHWILTFVVPILMGVVPILMGLAAIRSIAQTSQRFLALDNNTAGA